MQEIQKNKICHRDLKLENILLDESTNAKIADFGLSNVFDNSHLLKTFCGSPLYASPEIVRGTPYCGPEVDCWSLGVLLYTLVYGAMPFDGSNFKRLVKQISNGDYYEPKTTAEASSLIKFMLTVDSLKRATIKDVCSNSWINEGFDEPCLIIAEGLVHATPVRLDILLSLASPINTANVVIPKHTECFNLKSEKKTKTNVKRGNGALKAEEAYETLIPSKTKSPNEVKRKQVVKKKSKSSPLLELIVDVEEENEREIDDGGDTLSEISEIQTIAESTSEIKDKIIKWKEEITPEDEITSTISEKKTEIKSSKPIAKNREGETDIVHPPQRSKFGAQTGFENKIAIVKAEDVSQISNVALKRKIVQTVEASSAVNEKLSDSVKLESIQNLKELEENSAMTTQVEGVLNQPFQENEVKIQNSQKPGLKRKIMVTDRKTEENKTYGENASAGLDQSVPKDLNTQEETSTPNVLASQRTMKQRSDSINSENTSPTRIERRNSKVISQKTAELIQNLETKTLTSQDNTKGKKFVFPSLKVSDAKNRFETCREIRSDRLLQPKVVEAKQVNDKEKKQNLAGDLKLKFQLKSTSPSQTVSIQSSKNDVMSKNEHFEPFKKYHTESIKNEHTESFKNEYAEPPRNRNRFSSNKVNNTVTQKENQKEKTVSSSPVVVLNSPTLTREIIDESIKDGAPIVHKTTESNLGLKVEISDDESNSPRRSRSPRKTELNKVVKEQPVKMSVLPNDEHISNKETESTTKSSLKLKTHSSINEPNLKAAVSKLVIVSPETAPSSTNQAFNLPLLISEKTAIPTESVVSSQFDSNMELTTKEKLMKLPPQSKEQAAKKIGSVIQKIVSSESVNKELDNRKTGTASSHRKLDAKPASFRTEIQGFVVAPDGGKQTVNKTQRTEVTFPMAAATSQERIIPIKLIDESSNGPTTSSRNNSSTNMSRSSLQRMDSTKSSLSFSRQNSSDTESSIGTAAPKYETLKKSPREFIIPIKMESGLTVTPKEDVLNSDASMTEDNFRLDSRLRSGRFGQQKRYSRLLSDSSVEDEPVSVSVSASTSRRSSITPSSHVRSLSQGDEPQTPGAPSRTGFKSPFKRKQNSKLDRSDSCSSADEDEEDAFEVLTAESLFTSLLDRVRNLTKRLNRENSAGPSWALSSESSSLGLWGNNSPLQELMTRAPSETRHFISPAPAYSTVRSYSREPSVTVTITTGPGWTQNLSREMSGESDSVCSEAQSISGSHNQGRSYSSIRNPKETFDAQTISLRSVPHLNSRRQFQSPFKYSSPITEPATTSLSSAYNPNSRPSYGRTINQSDYVSHSTLPLRRPARSYERSYTGREFNASSTPLNISSVSTFSTGIDHGHRSSVIASSKLDFSKAEPPSNFSRYRTFSRASSNPDPEATVSSGMNGETGIQCGNNNATVQTNGWVGGPTSSSTKTTAVQLTTQEKMNKYQNYYYNLNKYPTRRLDILNPAAHPISPMRPSTMYETSFIDNGANSSTLNKSEVFAAEGSLGDSANTSNSLNTNLRRVPGALKKASPERNCTEGKLNAVGTDSPSLSKKFPSVEDFGTSAPLKSCYNGPQGDPSNTFRYSFRKRPELPIKQHRPCSISSFMDQPDGILFNSEPRFQALNSVLGLYTSRQAFSPTQELINNPMSFMRQESSKSDFNCARIDDTHMTPPLPARTEDLGKAQVQVPYPKLRRDVRATSVEKITRFLERKSKPREIPPQEVNCVPAITTDNEPPINPKNKEMCIATPEKQMKPGSTSKISKPKFIQSLEKKWEKFTNKADENVPLSSFTPEPIVSDNSEECVPSPNESVLLQRAISPEKNPKTKFGATTVNFMLGKFRRMEEGSSNSKIVKNADGKPPIGVLPGIGRRLQSPYTGARSDSILTFQANAIRDPDTCLLGMHTNTKIGSPLSYENTKTELIKVEIPQDLMRPNRQSKTDKEEIPFDNASDHSEKKVPRPLSSEFTSTNTDMSKSESFIPRFQRIKNGQGSSIVKLLPDINMINMPPIVVSSESNAEEHPLTPISVSDSFDSVSVSSEKTEVSMKSSVLEDEESVSDRILRKSFYSRFNSLDRKKPSSSSASSVSMNRHNLTTRSATTWTVNASDIGPGSSILNRINKYNPNPLFKELITDEFNSSSARKNNYSRRVTSKLSQLLSEIDSDIKSCSVKSEFIRAPNNYETKIKSEK